VALSFAALLVAGRPGSRAAWVALALTGGAGLLLLLGPAGGLLGALDRAWIVLVSVAFAGCATVRPAPARFWPLALRACLYTAAGVAILGPLTIGPAVWREIQWEATRGASGTVRRVIEIAPGLYPAFEPAVRLLAGGWPVWLVLETLVALALAWRGHAALTRTPLAAPA